MNFNRCKSVIISLLIISICFCILPLFILGSSRGITIKTKTSSGAIKEIQLYSGYHALIAGVSDYDSWPDLPYATKDAQDVARALKKLGFTVKTIFNPSSRDLKKALNSLTYKYGRESNRAILFYYAGHGETEKLADGTKLGYIIPKDCPLLRDDPEGFVNKAISMKDIEAYSLRILSKHVLMLFDSCFSGSLFSLVRAVPEDITEKSTLPVRQYITAGTEDEAVPDRSMFKRCLLLGLEGDADLTRDGYITGTELGLYLSDKVIQNTCRAQHPQYGKIRTPELARGDFIFRLASSGVIVEPAKSKIIILPKEGETSSSKTTKLSEKLIGVWEGVGYQHNNNSSWSIKMKITLNSYSIDYPSLSCGGRLTILSQTSDYIEFREKITYGKFSCVDNGKIVVSEFGKNKIKWLWYYSSGKLGSDSMLTRSKL